jgi:uncharacterized protein YgiM (DUF1202 family)
MHNHGAATARSLRHIADRRVLLKAAAGLAATIAAGAPRHERAAAQQSGDVVTGFFAEATATGQFTTADAACTFQASFPFFAIAPHWAGAAPDGVRVVLSLSYDGLDYSDPVVVTRTEDAGPADRDGRHFGHLVVADGHEWVRYETQDASGAPIALPDLVFHYYDATNGPKTSGIFTAAEVTQPTVIARATWGCDEALRHEGQDAANPVIWTEEFQTVEHVIVHHTVTTNFQDPMVTIRSIYQYHAVERGWGDIGYNYLVDYLGNVYEGRFGGENVVGGHSLRYNYGSSGVAVMGDFMSIDATPEAQTALIWIVAWLARGLDPLGAAFFVDKDDVPTICAHRDVLSTECPGDVLFSDLEYIRASVADVIDTGNEIPDDGIAVGDYVAVTIANANLRSGPGTNKSVIRQVPLGTILTVTDGPTDSGGYTWWGVSGAIGSGWMASAVLEETADAPPEAGAFAVGDTVNVATDALNLRSSASTSAGIVAKMPNGTSGVVVGGPTNADGYTWWRLQTTLGLGWAVETYLAAGSGSGPTPPPTPTPGAFAAGDVVVVATDSLFLRSGAGTGQSAIGSMPNGTELTVISGPTSSGGYSWYRVQHPTYGPGYAAGEFLAEGADTPDSGQFAIGSTVQTTDSLRLRASASTSGATIATLPAGAVLRITSGPSSQGGYAWYGVSSTTYGNGYCAGAFLTASGGTTPGAIAVGAAVVVVGGSLNLRSGPGTSAPVATVLASGTMLTVLAGPQSASGYTWWRVQTDSGAIGWCVATYLQAT